MTLSFSGLTLAQVIAQSRACHPDWTGLEHAEYLLTEEPFERAEVVEAVAKFFGVDPAVLHEQTRTLDLYDEGVGPCA